MMQNVGLSRGLDSGFDVAAGERVQRLRIRAGDEGVDDSAIMKNFDDAFVFRLAVPVDKDDVGVTVRAEHVLHDAAVDVDHDFSTEHRRSPAIRNAARQPVLDRLPAR